MQAFLNKEEVKIKYTNRVRAHADADKITKGIYWKNGKGCAVGCTIEGSDHSRYETELGIPKEVAYLEDVLFEELPNEIAKDFPLRFLEAVKVGSDLSKVTAKMVIWQFEDEKYGLKNIKEIQHDREGFSICEEVTKGYKRVLVGKEVSDEEWERLYKKADEIYWARAWAGAGAGEKYDSYIIAMTDKFIELIKESK